MAESKTGLAGSVLGFILTSILGFNLLLDPPEGESIIPLIFVAASLVHLIGIWASHGVTRLRAAVMVAVACTSFSLVLLFGVPLYPGVVGHEVGLLFVPATLLLFIAGGWGLLQKSGAVR